MEEVASDMKYQGLKELCIFLVSISLVRIICDYFVVLSWKKTISVNVSFVSLFVLLSSSLC